MQDNHSQKEKDAAFEDKAWMDMRELLDKEMPVQKKKRFFFWWWGIGGILLLLALIGSLFMFTQTQAESLKDDHRIVTNKPSVNTEKQTNMGALNTGASATKTKIEAQKKVSTDKQINKTKENNKSTRITKRNNLAQNKISQGTTHSIAIDDVHRDNIVHNIVPKNIIANDASMNTKHSSIDSLKALEEITLSSLGSSLFNKENSTVLLAKKEQVLISQLPILSLIDLPINAHVPSFPTYAIPKKSRMDWAIVASLGTFKLTRFNEYNVGLITSYQLYPKWKLGTGLNYHYFRLNGLVKMEDNILAIDELEVEKSMDQLPIPTVDSATNTTSGTTMDPAADMDDLSGPEIEQIFVDPLTFGGHANYISVPFFLEYQMSSKFKVDVGAAYYYQLTNSYDDINNRLKARDWTSFIGLNYTCTSYLDLRFSYERIGSAKRSTSVNTNAINIFEELILEKESISPLENRFKLSSVWRF